MVLIQQYQYKYLGSHGNEIWSWFLDYSVLLEMRVSGEGRGGGWRDAGIIVCTRYDQEASRAVLRLERFLGSHHGDGSGLRSAIVKHLVTATRASQAREIKSWSEEYPRGTNNVPLLRMYPFLSIQFLRFVTFFLQHQSNRQGLTNTRKPHLKKTNSRWQQLWKRRQLCGARCKSSSSGRLPLRVH